MEELKIKFWTHLALNILFVLEMEDSHPMEGQFSTSKAKETTSTIATDLSCFSTAISTIINYLQARCIIPNSCDEGAGRVGTKIYPSWI
jgi:hypothetical protein